MKQQKVLDEVVQMTINLLIDEPFYGYILTGLVREASDEVGALGLSLLPPQTVLLKINPTCWNEELFSLPLKYGAVKHEILHILCRHVTRIQDFEQHAIFNIAADLVVNQYILPEQLAEGAIELSDFPDLPLAPHQDAGYYYRQLLACWKIYLKGSGDASGALINDLIRHSNNHLERHKYWLEGFGQLKGVERKILERSIDEILRNALNRTRTSGAGDLHERLKIYLRSFLSEQPAIVDWRRMLRLFAAGSRKTKLKNTIRRPSKRYGTTPGIKVKRLHKILVALDTSGSIRQADLDRFFAEIRHIWRQGAGIRIVECDSRITAQYDYKGIKPRFVKGKGGTAFDAPIRYANDEYRPDAIVYFTDGLGPAPKIRARMPVLWLITSRGLKPGNTAWKDLPGRKVIF